MFRVAESRYQSGGRVTTPEQMTEQVIKSFNARVKENEYGCLVWTGGKQVSVHMWATRSKIPARDIAYFIKHGTTPTCGFVPKCGNRMCVNLDHMMEKCRKGRPSLTDAERKKRKAQRQRVWRAKKLARLKESAVSQTVETAAENAQALNDQQVSQQVSPANQEATA